MAHWYGSIQGNKGEATRIGTKISGLKANLSGWSIGVTVECVHDEATKKDRIYVYKTLGSSSSTFKEIIAIVEEGED